MPSLVGSEMCIRDRPIHRDFCGRLALHRQVAHDTTGMYEYFVHRFKDKRPTKKKREPFGTARLRLKERKPWPTVSSRHYHSYDYHMIIWYVRTPSCTQYDNTALDDTANGKCTSSSSRTPRGSIFDQDRRKAKTETTIICTIHPPPLLSGAARASLP